MRTLSPEMLAHLSNRKTTLVVCWAIYRNRDRLEVSGMTSAAAATVSVVYPHGLAVGDSVQLEGLGGAVGTNRQSYRVTSTPSPTSFVINYDSTGDTYTSGGTVRRAYGFTNSDTDLLYKNVRYRAQSGTLPTKAAMSSDASVGNMEITTLLSGAVTRQSILTGMWDSSRTEVFMVNVAGLLDGEIPVLKGWIGTVRLADTRAVFEVRDLAQAMQQRQGEKITPSCRNELGGPRCGVDLSGFTDSGEVTATIGRVQFEDSAQVSDDEYFTGGRVVFTTGANTGFSMDVIKYESQRFTLSYRLPYALQAGDQYTATAGCDKTLAVCKNTFANTENFRGEPYVPLTETVSKYGSNI